MTDIKINREYASLVHPLTTQEYQALKQSIEQKGQLEEIVTNSELTALDGHNRLKICQELGIEPRIRIKSFDNSLREKMYVIECNLKRRQLNDFQKAELALKLEAIEAEEAERRMKNGKTLGPNEPRGKARDIAARKAGISGTTYERAKLVMGKATEGIIEKVRAGKISVYKAFKLTNIEAKRQRLISEAAKNSFSNSSNIELYLGDFREQGSKIADNSIDLILTDPPYNRASLPLYKDLGILAARVLKDGGSLVTIVGHYALVKCANYIEESELRYIHDFPIIHSGCHAQIYEHNISVMHKPMLWFIKGAKENPHKIMNDVIYSRPPKKILHKWEQSSVEAEHIINGLTVGENQIVLDPFMGSAQWGRAALKLNRKFIGIDINPETFQLAKANLAKER